jgi:hypothetical protein
MEEIVESLFHWKAPHPRIEVEVGCHYVAGSQTAIDALLPDGREALRAVAHGA